VINHLLTTCGGGLEVGGLKRSEDRPMKTKLWSPGGGGGGGDGMGGQQNVFSEYDSTTRVIVFSGGLQTFPRRPKQAKLAL